MRSARFAKKNKDALSDDLQLLVGAARTGWLADNSALLVSDAVRGKSKASPSAEKRKENARRANAPAGSPGRAPPRSPRRGGGRPASLRLPTSPGGTTRSPGGCGSPGKIVIGGVIVGDRPGMGDRQSSRARARTVAEQFRAQLGELMAHVGGDASQNSKGGHNDSGHNSGGSWYVRCVKTNASKEAWCFDADACAHQLRCAGMLEAVRISDCHLTTRAQ